MPFIEPHHAVQFATRYGSPTHEYLNAWTAIIRLEDLIEDAKTLKKHLDAAEPEENRWHPWFGAELISYYAIGFVTCLEWHARSRLVDLLTFKPAAAKSEDVRILKDKVILEMLATNVTVASIVGAATNISSFNDYMGVFSRLFSAFDPQLDAFKIIKAVRADTGAPWVENREIVDMQHLYAFRNNLVHEIGIDRVGHRNVRENWDPAEAIRIGELVRRIVEVIEAAVSARMPTGFPNILGIDGLPTSEWQRLEQELPRMEQKIRRMATEFTEPHISLDPTLEPAQASAKEYINREMEFLDSASMFHNRYVELREPLKLALIRSRHAYLKSIIDTVGEVWMLEGETNDEQGQSHS